MPKQTFKVGSFYKRVKETEAGDGIKFDSESNVFQCHYISDEGCAWTMNCSYDGARCDDDGEGWCVATPKDLNDGAVTLYAPVKYPK